MNAIELTTAQRQLLAVLVTQAWVRLRDDPEMEIERKECEALMLLLAP